MSNAREIITLQFGHFSNFVGTHFWNIQETSFNYTSPESEINNDVLYREGQTLRGEVTYTPRLLVVDLNGSLKHLSQDGGDLYNQNETQNSISTWYDNVEVKKVEEAQKSTLQQTLETSDNLDSLSDTNIENEVDVWSDFLYGRLHPRTVNIVNEYEHNNDAVPFQTFYNGSSLWQTEYFKDNFTDKIRLYAEECDNLQGFQFFVDVDNGFSGLGASCLDYVREDFENKSILTCPLISSFHKDYKYNSTEDREKSIRKNCIRQINTALSYSSFCEPSSLVIPMSTDSKGWNRDRSSPRNFRYLQYNNEFYYHTSAILASAIDTITLRYRQKNNIPSYLFHVCNDLNGLGRKMAAASIGLPFGLRENEDLIDCLNSWEGPLWDIITPNCNISTDRCMQSIVLRGIPDDRLKRPPEATKTQRELPAYKCNSIREMLTFYLACSSYATASHVTTISKPLTTKKPFPNIFNLNVSQDGYISNNSRDMNTRVDTTPVIGGLHSSAEIGEMLETLYNETLKLKIVRFNEFNSSEVEIDEYKEKLNEIMNLRECYIDEHYL